MKSKSILVALFVALAAAAPSSMPAAAQAGEIFVQEIVGVFGFDATTGAAINGYNPNPGGGEFGGGSLALSGNDIFAAQNANNTIGEYTTSGATVNASFITGLPAAYTGINLAVSGGDLFVPTC